MHDTYPFAWATAGAFVALVVQYFWSNWLGKKEKQRECPHYHRNTIESGKFGSRYICRDCGKDWWE